MVVLALFLLGLAPSLATTNANQADYWEGRFEHPAQCFKHEGSSSHGNVVGNGVVLNEFQQQWPGDHWEALIVKGGSVDNGFGPGNAVYAHPSAGVNYPAQDNAAGRQAGVSHWIACKGTTPETTTTTGQQTTTTTTAPPSTTTTVPSTSTTSSVVTTTTTTVPATTTTTAPETTTTTTVPETTTTVPETTTTVPEELFEICHVFNGGESAQLFEGLTGAEYADHAAHSDFDPFDGACELPFTGIELNDFRDAALVAFVLGGITLAYIRRKEMDLNG